MLDTGMNGEIVLRDAAAAAMNKERGARLVVVVGVASAAPWLLSFLYSCQSDTFSTTARASRAVNMRSGNPQHVYGESAKRTAGK